MIKRLEHFIDNLNSGWAKLMVLNMPETHTLQQIFTQLQKMACSASLDKDAMSAPSKQTKFALNCIHSDRKGLLDGSFEGAGSRQSEQLSRQSDQLADYKQRLDDKTFELHELKESTRTPMQKAKAPLHCSHCPPHRADTHNTEQCFRGPNQEDAGKPSPQRFGGGGGGRPSGAPARAGGRDCYNCGQPGHFAANRQNEK